MVFLLVWDIVKVSDIPGGRPCTSNRSSDGAGQQRSAKSLSFRPSQFSPAGRRSGVKKSDRRMCFGYRVGSVLGLATGTGSAVRVASGYIRRMARKPRSRGDSVVPARRMMADMLSA